jgi:hypothetical protein
MATKRGPGAHVLARKGNYEKAEGQLEMSFRPPKEDLYAALYSGRQMGKSWSRDFLQQLISYESTILTDMVRAQAAGSVSGRVTFPGPAQQIERVTAEEVSRRQRDWFQMVDFRGRVYPQLTEAYREALTVPYGGRRSDTIIADDVYFS